MALGTKRRSTMHDGADDGVPEKAQQPVVDAPKEARHGCQASRPKLLLAEVSDGPGRPRARRGTSKRWKMHSLRRGRIPGNPSQMGASGRGGLCRVRGAAVDGSRYQRLDRSLRNLVAAALQCASGLSAQLRFSPARLKQRPASHKNGPDCCDRRVSARDTVRVAV